MTPTTRIRPAAARARARSCGSMMIEALIALLVLSFGILAMMGVSRAGISAQSDAQVRTDAARLANEIVQEMWLRVDRSSKTSEAKFQDSLEAFAYQPDGADCEFSGAQGAAANTDLPVGDWLAKVKNAAGGGLPGSTSDAFHQIKVEKLPAGGTGGLNQVTVTLCWQTPVDVAPRKHSVVAQVN